MLNYFNSKLNLKLTKGMAFSGGRNFYGRICVKGRGSGNKRLFYFINFFNRLNIFGRVCKIIYDSRRLAPIICVLYDNGLASYNILVDGLKIGSRIYNGSNIVNLNSINFGWSTILGNLRLFSIINCIELYPYFGAKLVRAAGTCAILIGKLNGKGIIKLRSGWTVNVSLDCFSVYGKISKSIYNVGAFLKAGKMRAFGFKSKVRGVAKNPCDHPHGGGNGKKSKPPIPVNAWGRFLKWLPTKNTKRDKKNRRIFKSSTL